MKHLYFYYANSREDEYNETKIIKDEVRTGMTDPVRTVAIIELQNFIKKNVGKKQKAMKITDKSTADLMVKEKEQ